jgi:CheY-like chemotaxis protein
LLIAQGGLNAELAPLAAQFQNIADIATQLALGGLAARARDCRSAVERSCDSPDQAYRALDAIAALEAELLDIGLDEEFLSDAADLLDNSINDVAPAAWPTSEPSEFAIDEETLEVFRSEGEELLANISIGVDILEASPSDQNALWDIRRSSHTFKGAAGIVGLSDAATLAHRMEDLLDRLVESDTPASREVIEFVRGCVRSLGSVLDGSPANAAGLEIAYSSAVNSLGSSSAAASAVSEAPVKTGQRVESTATVRFSLAKLSEIVRMAEDLRVRPTLSDADRALAADIHQHLLRLRMVRFGNLETRLARAVSVTATEVGKKALLEIETPDVEIDTLMVDALVEPLLHLIKNAVVHGIESPEMRRMVGKHEFGLITVRVDADGEAVVLTLSDDGAGIAVQKLKEKAVGRGTISADRAQTMSDREAYKLLFDRGLTTADHIDLNAGRGIGMGIVKDGVESRGGSIHIDSVPNLGTTFTLMLPVLGENNGAENTILKTGSDERDSPSPVERRTTVLAPGLSAPPLVLVVDDSPTIRRHNQRIVEHAGLRCITAEHGADALELLLNGSIEPDLVLSDIEMPHMDGLALLEYIKTDDHLGHVPVVMVTSLDGDHYRALAANLGASDYIVKPLRENDIARMFSHMGVKA